MSTNTQTTEPESPGIDKARFTEPHVGNVVGYWFSHLVALGYCGVILAAISTQFTQHEMPCPLCMLQRMAMVLIGIGAIWMVGQARKGTLTLGGYVRCYSLMIFGALLGYMMSRRQVLLHILPGDPGYGGTVLGYHLYTWAALTFLIVLLYTAIMLLFVKGTFPIAPAGKGALWTSRIIVWFFWFVIALNAVLVFLEEGLHWYLPDDPTSYLLLQQLGIG